MPPLCRIGPNAARRTLWLLICLGASACGPHQDGETSVARNDTEKLRQQLTEQATENYTLGNPELPVSADPLPISSAQAAHDIQVFAFSMSRNVLSLPEAPRFVAAVLSTKEYPRLGIRKGMNYILKLTKDGQTAFVLVPDKDHAKMFFLKYTDINDATHGSPPHVIRKEVRRTTSGTRTIVDYVVGGCIEGCATGHCGVTDTGDEFTATSAARWNLKGTEP